MRIIRKMFKTKPCFKVLPLFNLTLNLSTLPQSLPPVLFASFGLTSKKLQWIPYTIATTSTKPKSA